MVVPKAEKGYGKYAWILLFLSSAYLIFPSLGSIVAVVSFGPAGEGGITWDELTARTQDPTVARSVQFFYISFATSALLSSILGMVISVVSYRRGQRWAWYVSLYLPALLAGTVTSRILTSGAESVLSASYPLRALFLIPLIIALLGVLLPFRKFFPRKVPTVPRA